MNFSNKFLRGVALVLMILILIPAMPSYAKSFKDVPKTHWAYSYIDNMSNLGYIQGDPDGKFRPTDSLTYLETLTLLSQLLPISESEKAEVELFRPIVKKYNVAVWAQEAVMKCLYKEVISENELKLASDNGMIKVGTKTVPSRLTISVYLAKAMGLEDIANKKPFVALQYKDLLKIDSKYHKILFTLIEVGVLDPKGTGTGNFEPAAKIQRDAMATMLSKAHDYLLKNPPVVAPPADEPPVETAPEVTKGTITKITQVGTNTFITIMDRLNKETAILVDSSFTITLDNKAATIASLVVGQEADVEVFYRPGKVRVGKITLRSSLVEEDIVGTIKAVYPATNKIVVDYSKDKVNKTVELNVDKKADITLNGKLADIYDLKAGDELKLYSKNNVVLKIEATAKVGKAEGTIVLIRKDERTSTVKYYITIEDAKKNIVEYELDSKAYVYRNKRSAKPEDLRVGDMAYVELDYNLIVDIEAEVVVKEIEGSIVAISTRLNRNTEITIKNRTTNKEETYELARDAFIKVDNKVATTFDLKLGYFVEIVVAGNEITDIYADSVGSEYFIRGKVISLRSVGRREFEVEVINTDIDNIGYKDKIIIKANNDLILTNLILNMDVVVFGYYDGYSFIANSIR